MEGEKEWKVSDEWDVAIQMNNMSALLYPRLPYGVCVLLCACHVYIRHKQHMQATQYHAH